MFVQKLENETSLTLEEMEMTTGGIGCAKVNSVIMELIMDDKYLCLISVDYFLE